MKMRVEVVWKVGEGISRNQSCGGSGRTVGEQRFLESNVMI